MAEKDITHDFLSKEREAQMKRETTTITSKITTESTQPGKSTSVVTETVKPVKEVTSAIAGMIQPVKQVTTAVIESMEPNVTTTTVPESAQAEGLITTVVTETVQPVTELTSFVTTTQEKVVTSVVTESTQPDKVFTSTVTETVHPGKVITSVVTETIQPETVITRTITESGHPEQVITTVVTETVQPVKEVRIVETVQSEHDQQPRDIVFTTRHTETSYTTSSYKDEPAIFSEVTTVIKDGTSSTTEEIIETTKKVTVSSGSKFDVSKIRTDTLGHFDVGDIDEIKKFAPKDLDLTETPEITKEEVKSVIDDILHKSSIVAAARSPTLDKDIKTITKEIVETEKRSYDAKVPHKEERRHSCISPAISLERIAESEVETEEEPPKKMTSLTTETHKVTEMTTEMKKSDSAMKQMADNIEIIIKQASEDVDVSSEEHPVDDETQDIAGRVSVDSIIEEAVTTVEGYLDEKDAKDLKEQEIEAKKEMIYEETKKFTKDRPGLIKSLSRDSGEIVIMPKKKHPRTFSVQSSPEEVEEQIYTDSESGEQRLNTCTKFRVFLRKVP